MDTETKSDEDQVNDDHLDDNFSTCYEDLSAKRGEKPLVSPYHQIPSTKLSVFNGAKQSLNVVASVTNCKPDVSQQRGAICSPPSSNENISSLDRRRSGQVRRRDSGRTTQRRPVSVVLPEQYELKVHSTTKASLPDVSSSSAAAATASRAISRNSSKGSSMNKKSRTLLEEEQSKNVKRRKSFFHVQSSPSLQNVIVRYRHNKTPTAATQKLEKKSRRLSLPNFFGGGTGSSSAPNGGGFSVIKNVLLASNSSPTSDSPSGSTPELVSSEKYNDSYPRKNTHRKSSIVSLTSNGSFKHGFIFARKGKDKEDAR